MVIRIVLDEDDDHSHGGDKEPAIKKGRQKAKVEGRQPEQLGCLRMSCGAFSETAGLSSVDIGEPAGAQRG